MKGSETPSDRGKKKIWGKFPRIVGNECNAWVWFEKSFSTIVQIQKEANKIVHLQVQLSPFRPIPASTFRQRLQNAVKFWKN